MSNLFVPLSLAGPGPVRTRFAPSPTGSLHLGHVVNAIYVWGVARAAGGEVVLRIEDHDRLRCRPSYEAGILDDLAWLGFAPDEGLVPLLRQSEREEVYREALGRLRQSHRVYACDCSRRQMPVGPYSGRCRSRGLAETTGRGLRVEIGDGVERFTDALVGGCEQTPCDQSGDPLLRDRNGHWTYQFAVTVDDLRMQISHVVRGADLLDSTGRQLRLRRMLGGTGEIAFCHHPLILKPGGEKLSKSAADTGVSDLRRRGLTAPDVIGLAAAAIGLVPPGTLVTATEVQQLIQLSCG